MFSSQNSQVSNDAVFVEDIFSTTLYTGNDSAQTITNGIDLAGEGGLVWGKSRSASQNHRLYDTARGSSYSLISNATSAESNQGTNACAFNADGFSLSAASGIVGSAGFGGPNYASWTFRKQPKFFDVVTWSGNGVDGRDISHSLGSSPGFVVIKCTSSSTYWVAKHKDALSLTLNTTNAQGGSANTTNGYVSLVSSTSFNVVAGLTDLAAVNASGQTYVAYLFAHNAGGFGLTGTDNVISCGLTTANGSGDFSVTLGYEPQWVLIKSTGSGIWSIVDNMRGATASSGYTSSQRLQPQSSAAEDTLNSGYGIGLNATGFTGNLATFSNDFIYIAIRRGPMKVPTIGTSVFSPSTYTGDDGSNREITGLSFTPDLMLNAMRLENGSGRSPSGFYWFDRLRGKGARLRSSQTLAEFLVGPAYEGVNFRSYSVDAASGESNYNPALYVSHLFKRAPSFFDEVCYTGDGADNRQVIHNLGVTPELVIVKPRSVAWQWWVYHTGLGNTRQGIVLNSTAAKSSNVDAFSTDGSAFSSSYFLQSASSAPYPPNANGCTYVAYLFATCDGVSKVGSYTGNGSSQTINCGFTGGARFVMIKATSTTGNWIVADSARGIVAGNDPALYLNSTAAEVTSFDWIDADNSGFVVNETSTIAANTNGVTYIYLAIA